MCLERPQLEERFGVGFMEVKPIAAGPFSESLGFHI
jgi:hypothetical protein